MTSLIVRSLAPPPRQDGRGVFPGLHLASDQTVRPLEKRRQKALAGVIAAGWLALVGLFTFAVPAFNRYKGRVVAISENAIVMVLREGRPESLRLAEIEFPEKGHPHAREARAYANKLALGQVVSVEETRLPDGSRVGYVTLSDGRSLSAELVKAGLAWPSTNRPGRLASSLVVLQTRAMVSRRGLWAEPSGSARLARPARTRTTRSFEVLPSATDSEADDTDDTASAEAPTPTDAALGAN